MADREWFRVESSQGTALALDGRTDFPNKETAVAAARNLVPLVTEDVLIVVKYSRKEVRSLTRQLSIAEADIASA